MAYIGKTPVIGNFQKCDSIAVVNGQAAYTLQVGGTNVSPQSENHMLVSLNGILQAPVDSFTVSGSTLTFASNLVTGDVIDFVMILGNVLDLGVPSDNTVSLAKLTATGTKDATTFLRGDNTFAEAGGGKVLQVVSATKTDTQAFSSSTFSDITGLSVSITPSSTSSKILVFGYAMVAWDGSLSKIAINLLRDSTNILLGDTAGSRIRTSGFTYLGIACNGTFSLPVNFLDSPNTTSATTYKIQASALDNSGNVYINRSFVDTDNATFARTASTITAMEIST
jgi:hypothetical protein